jgi:hypothetical protein
MEQFLRYKPDQSLILKKKRCYYLINIINTPINLLHIQGNSRSVGVTLGNSILGLWEKKIPINVGPIDKLIW